MSRPRPRVLGGLSRRLRRRLDPATTVGARPRGLIAAASAVALHRPLADLSAALAAVTDHHPGAVAAVLLGLAAPVALRNARGDAASADTFGASLVGGTLLAAVVVVASLGRLEALGPGTLAVGVLASTAAAALSLTVAVWTVRAADSRAESLTFGTAATGPLLAGPWFAALAPTAVPGVDGAAAATVIAAAVALTLAVGVVHGAYRRALARARVRPDDLLADRERSDGV